MRMTDHLSLRGLSKNIGTLGAVAENQVIVDVPTVSGTHAALSLESGSLGPNLYIEVPVYGTKAG